MKIKAKIHDVCVFNGEAPQLIVAESNIKGAGHGLFSQAHFSKGEPICEYKGDLVHGPSLDDQSYVMDLSNPHLIDADGKKLVIDANPMKAEEIGYGGFINDRYMDYPQELINLTHQFSGVRLSTTAKINAHASTWEPSKKIKRHDKRVLKKILKRAVKVGDRLRDLRIKLGYNAAYQRLRGTGAFIVISICEIFPGDEIYASYGLGYWLQKNDE